MDLGRVWCAIIQNLLVILIILNMLNMSKINLVNLIWNLLSYLTLLTWERLLITWMMKNDEMINDKYKFWVQSQNVNTKNIVNYKQFSLQSI